jgi:hypothetical protein
MRVFIYPVDIQLLTGKHINTARRIYNYVLDAYGKIERDSNMKIKKKQPLTITDYCNYHGLDEEQIKDIINNPKQKKK